MDFGYILIVSHQDNVEVKDCIGIVLDDYHLDKINIDLLRDLVKDYDLYVIVHKLGDKEHVVDVVHYEVVYDVL